MTQPVLPPVLSIRQLSVALPQGADRVHAVHQVSLTIHAGQTVCVVGESGSGKSVMATTVMGLLAKELKPTTGEVLLQGESLLDAPAARLRALRGRSMGMVLTTTAPALVAASQQATMAGLLDERISTRLPGFTPYTSTKAWAMRFDQSASSL